MSSGMFIALRTVPGKQEVPCACWLLQLAINSCSAVSKIN